MNQFLIFGRRRRRVLAVDDELINRELIEAILALNYDVTCASDGREAMEILRSAEEPYSLILLDLLMPQMSGFEVLEACKADEKLSEIPIIVMTSEKSAEVRSIKMGADDFITKPYRMPEVILARCERIIELSEEKQLIRSIEKDPKTGLYHKLFFDAYVKRLSHGMKRAMDAVVISVEGTEDQTALKAAADLTESVLLNGKGIACCAKENLFYAFVTHRMNYEEVFSQIEEQLCDQNITLKAGICEKVTASEPVKSWFEKARSVCERAAKEDSSSHVAFYTE